MKVNTLEDFLAHELKDLHSAEKMLLRALPKMAKAATDEELRDAFERHLEQTQEHVNRLEEVCQELGITPRGHKCKGMEGILAEGEELLENGIDPAVRDAALIASAQRVEHYEIAAYGCATTYCAQLGHERAKELLGQTLEEEKETDRMLTEIAEASANPEAASEAEFAEEDEEEEE
jgi:ferritin-like metal-binding protein YciE